MAWESHVAHDVKDWSFPRCMTGGKWGFSLPFFFFTSYAFFVFEMKSLEP